MNTKRYNHRLAILDKRMLRRTSFYDPRKMTPIRAKNPFTGEWFSMDYMMVDSRIDKIHDMFNMLDALPKPLRDLANYGESSTADEMLTMTKTFGIDALIAAYEKSNLYRKG